MSLALRKFTKFAVPAALALGVAVADANAQSLQAGTCSEKAAVEAVLAKEGQKPIFIGKRVAIGVMPTNVVLMSDSGYGYNIEEIKEKGVLCIGAAFKHIALNYPDNPNIPVWGSSIKPNKGIDVQKVYQNNGRLVFGAQTFTKDANGAEILGKAIVVATAPLDKTASVWRVDANSLPTTSFGMMEFGIVTKNFDYFVGRGFAAKDGEKMAALAAPKLQ